MIAPGWFAHEERTGSELVKELGNDTESTGTREGLERGNSAAVHIGVVPAELSTTGTLVKVSETINRRVLLVELHVITDELFSLSNDGEDIGRTIVISVGTDTKVALLRVLVSGEASSERQDGVSGCLLNVGELVVEDSDSLHFESRIINYRVL